MTHRQEANLLYQIGQQLQQFPNSIQRSERDVWNILSSSELESLTKDISTLPMKHTSKWLMELSILDEVANRGSQWSEAEVEQEGDEWQEGHENDGQ